MTATVVSWVTVDDGGVSSGNATLSITAAENTGRTQRTKTLSITPRVGTTIDVTLTQAAANEFVRIDHVEDTSGNPVTSIPPAGQTIVIVGYANGADLYAYESNNTNYTSLGSDPRSSGVTSCDIEEADGTRHTAARMNSGEHGYGETAQYKFKITTVVSASETDRTIDITVESGNGVDELRLEQSAAGEAPGTGRD